MYLSGWLKIFTWIHWIISEIVWFTFDLSFRLGQQKERQEIKITKRKPTIFWSFSVKKLSVLVDRLARVRKLLRKPRDSEKCRPSDSQLSHWIGCRGSANCWKKPWTPRNASPHSCRFSVIETNDKIKTKVLFQSGKISKKQRRDGELWCLCTNFAAKLPRYWDFLVLVKLDNQNCYENQSSLEHRHLFHKQATRTKHFEGECKL